MSADRLRGMIAGGVYALTLVAVALGAYSHGRTSIVEQCIETRYFTFADGVWACVRTKMRVRNLEGTDNMQGDI